MFLPLSLLSLILYDTCLTFYRLNSNNLPVFCLNICFFNISKFALHELDLDSSFFFFFFFEVHFTFQPTFLILEGREAGSVLTNCNL
jgi:hypothetical protein